MNLPTRPNVLYLPTKMIIFCFKIVWKLKKFKILNSDPTLTKMDSLRDILIV